MSNKRYLFNSVSDPRIPNTLCSCFIRNRLEKNPGDMVYSYSVMNALSIDKKVDFLFTGYYHQNTPFSEKQIYYFNNSCDAFICPLANMLDPSWMHFTNTLTETIKKLKIPCVVPSISTTQAYRIGDNIDFENDVKKFISSILDKSAIIGVRGEFTGDFLKNLGYSEGRHYKVLGCPTLYTYGEKLPKIKKLDRGSFNNCALSINIRSSSSNWGLIDSCAKLFANSRYISQWHNDLYYFCISDGKWGKAIMDINPEYTRFISQYTKSNRFKFFLNRGPWKSFLSSQDLFIGERIHGALLSILSGTPAAITPFEYRTEELARFHGIPLLRPIEGESQEALKERIMALDFSQIESKQKQNFVNYHNFFKINNIPTIFDTSSCPSSFPLEEKLPQEYPDDTLSPWEHHTPQERAKALLVQEIMRARKEEHPKNYTTEPLQNKKLAKKFTRINSYISARPSNNTYPPLDHYLTKKKKSKKKPQKHLLVAIKKTLYTILTKVCPKRFFRSGK